MHAAMNRAGHHICREQTQRLLRLAGVHGVQRAAKVSTTRADPIAARPAGRVQRQFRADRPNQLWVVDITYVRTCQCSPTPRLSLMPVPG